MSCGECETKYDNGIIGWCRYCHNEINEDEAFITVNGDKYHVDCYEIINLHTDSFEG